MKKILLYLTMVIVWASAYAQSPQWYSYDSGTTFSNNLYSFTFRDDLYVSEEVTGNLWKSVEGSWVAVPSPGFGIKSSVDFNNEWWVVGDSTVSVNSGTSWITKKTVSGQLYCSAIGSDDKLYIGGFYTSTNGIKNIMCTDGSNFSSLDTTIDVGTVQALVVSPFNGYMQVCQGIDGPPTTHIIEWTGTNYQTLLNLPVINIVGKAVVCNSKVYYLMFCIDPNDVSSGFGHRLMSFDGTNWKKIADDFDNTIDGFYSDSSKLLFGCFGNIALGHDTIPTPFSGLYQLTSDSSAEQIGGILYGGISSTSKDANDHYVVTGYFSETSGGPFYADVLVFANVDTTTGGTDMINSNNTDAIHLFPNPTTDMITISGLPSTKTDIDIYDLVGRRVALYNDVVSMITLDVSNLSDGVYFLKTPKDVVKFIRK